MEKAENLNQNFVDASHIIIKSLRPYAAEYTPTRPRTHEPFELKRVTAPKFLTQLMLFKKDAVPGCDRLSGRIVRVLAPIPEQPLSYFCHISLEEGRFPEILKTGLAISVLKNFNQTRVL